MHDNVVLVVELGVPCIVFDAANGIYVYVSYKVQDAASQLSSRSQAHTPDNYLENIGAQKPRNGSGPIKDIHTHRYTYTYIYILIQYVYEHTFTYGNARIHPPPYKYATHRTRTAHGTTSLTPHTYRPGDRPAYVRYRSTPHQ